MNHSNQNAGSPLVKNEGLVKTRLTQIMVIFFMLGGVQVATQYFAYLSLIHISEPTRPY